MGIKTKIQYCDSSCNPIMGCSGCELYSPDPSKNHCYAAALCRRHAGHKGWPAEFSKPEFFPGRLEKALRWKDLTGTERPGKPWLNGKPRIIFVNDLSDTFGPRSPDPSDWLVPLMPMMGESPHIWLFLTKWPKRMYEFFDGFWYAQPRNFWGLTTITSQETVDTRIPWLLKTPLSVQGVSIEPMLGPVDVSAYMPHPSRKSLDWDRVPEQGDGFAYPFGVKWIICGSESGPGARPMDEDWVREVRDQCVAAGVAFFYKQKLWGGRKVSCPELDGKRWTEFPRGKGG